MNILRRIYARSANEIPYYIITLFSFFLLAELFAQVVHNLGINHPLMCSTQKILLSNIALNVKGIFSESLSLPFSSDFN